MKQILHTHNTLTSYYDSESNFNAKYVNENRQRIWVIWALSFYNTEIQNVM